MQQQQIIHHYSLEKIFQPERSHYSIYRFSFYVFYFLFMLNSSKISVFEHNNWIADPDMLKDVRRYSRQELEEACEDFSNIIGSSPDSVVYKGTMKGGPEIAVISLCIKEEHWTGYLELYFQREVNGNISMLKAQ
jgi:hypothetical protein